MNTAPLVSPATRGVGLFICETNNAATSARDGASVA
jgi:hypothetical protein